MLGMDVWLCEVWMLGMDDNSEDMSLRILSLRWSTATAMRSAPVASRSSHASNDGVFDTSRTIYVRLEQIGKMKICQFLGRKLFGTFPVKFAVLYSSWLNARYCISS